MNKQITKAVLPGLMGTLLMTGCAATKAPTEAVTTSQQQPNIIYILADDMGYGDAGVYGQTKIRTPNIDQLAMQGVRFTQHYSGNTVCAPSRASLLTGLHPGHAQIRGNKSLDRRGVLDDERGQLPLFPNTKTVATMLKQSGYATGIVGKWGLGGPANGVGPNDFGFDYFMGYADQKLAHNYYPTHLWENKEKYPLDNRYFHVHARAAGTSTKAEDYKRYQGNEFAPDVITAAAKKFIKANAQQPFFLYMAFPQPHAALQVPDEYVERYANENWPEPAMETLGKGVDYSPHPKPRAARAGLLSSMDDDIGEVVELIEKLKLTNNTIIIFASDNGPTHSGGQDIEFFNSQGGLRGTKRDLYEGGIRVPMIVKWPGKVPANRETSVISAFWDIAPTLAEITHNQPLPESDGISLLPYLLNPELQPQTERPLYWEYPFKTGVQAVRFGKWKAVKFDGLKRADGRFELYDLESDPTESKNIAAQHPEISAQLKEMMKDRSKARVKNWEFK